MRQRLLDAYLQLDEYTEEVEEAAKELLEPHLHPLLYRCIRYQEQAGPSAVLDDHSEAVIRHKKRLQWRTHGQAPTLSMRYFQTYRNMHNVHALAKTLLRPELRQWLTPHYRSDEVCDDPEQAAIVQHYQHCAQLAAQRGDSGWLAIVEAPHAE